MHQTFSTGPLHDICDKVAFIFKADPVTAASKSSFAISDKWFARLCRAHLLQASGKAQTLRAASRLNLLQACQDSQAEASAAPVKRRAALAVSARSRLAFLAAADHPSRQLLRSSRLLLLAALAADLHACSAWRDVLDENSSHAYTESTLFISDSNVLPVVQGDGLARNGTRFRNCQGRVLGCCENVLPSDCNRRETSSQDKSASRSLQQKRKQKAPGGACASFASGFSRLQRQPRCCAASRSCGREQIWPACAAAPPYLAASSRSSAV